MKALSLWQPWASAIPLGLKRIETRGWSTKHRGPIAIHAAKRWTPEQRNKASDMLDLPFGKMIAVANVFDVYDLDLLGLFVSRLERSWGDYSPGRFGWMLTDIRPLSQPFEFRGGQGLFNVPDDMIASAL